MSTILAGSAPSRAGRRASTAAAPELGRALRLSAALAAVSAASAAIGLLAPDVFHDPPMTVGNARGTALVTLVVAVPALLAAMWHAGRGSLRARVVWLGAVAYLLYNAVIFAFGVRFNALFPAYVASLALGVWSLAATVARLDVGVLPSRIDARFPARAVGGYLIAIAALFAAVWLRDIGPALVAGTAPAALLGTGLPTSPVHVLDLAFTLPLAALGGALLWRRRPWGYAIAGPLLVMLAIEGASVAVDQLFGHRADPSQPLTAVPLFAALAVVGLVPTARYLRALR